MKVMVTGSRTWRDYPRIRDVIADVNESTPISLVIHGGATGADMLADRACRSLRIPTELFLPNWRSEGRKAGVIRNITMIDQLPDQVLAFRSRGESRGTDHAIHHATKRGIPVKVVFE